MSYKVQHNAEQVLDSFPVGHDQSNNMWVSINSELVTALTDSCDLLERG